MVVVPDSKMGQLKELDFGAFFYYSDYNNIGSAGIKLLIKAELTLLQKV